MALPKGIGQNAMVAYALQGIFSGTDIKVTSFREIGMLGGSNIEAMIRLLRADKVGEYPTPEKREFRRNIIGYLEALVESGVEDTVLLPQYRGPGHFLEGQSVRVYNPGQDYAGNVIAGVHRDMMIHGTVDATDASFVAYAPEEEETGKGYVPDTQIKYHLNSPGILDIGEFCNLRENPQFAELWMRNANFSRALTGTKRALEFYFLR